MFKTGITEMLGIEYPILEGGMVRVGTGKLAAAVSNAGGLGMISSHDYPSREELRDEIATIEAELQPMIDVANETIKGLEEAIKADVVNHGSSVKGVYLMATYVKGRVKWDAKALNGYAAGHPEIEVFRSEGKPYASIKGV